ncbi:MAG: radical SAM protein [Acidimicrobiia bacterium]
MSSTLGLLADTIASSYVDGPGNRFAVFLQGCNFDCIACHNPNTIPRRKVGTSRFVEVDDLLAQVRDAAPFLSGVTVSGGEATCQWQFVQELFHGIKSDRELSRLTTFVDSNGNADLHVWDVLLPWMDAAMIDLKALDADVHHYLTGEDNERVLASIEHLADLSRLYEVRLLLVPGVNDTDAQLDRTAEWLLRVDPEMRVKLIGFRQHGTRRIAAGFADMTPERLDHARSVLEHHGVQDVVTV